jgi:hypothetical protein
MNVYFIGIEMFMSIERRRKKNNRRGGGSVVLLTELNNPEILAMDFRCFIY